MKRTTVLFALAALLAAPVHADIHIGTDDCRLHSDYSLAVNPDDLTFTRKDGSSATVVIANGTLRVDGRLLKVDSADQRRLLDMEHGVRQSVREVRAIAHAAISIAFEAVGEVAAAFVRDPAPARTDRAPLARYFAATSVAGDFFARHSASRSGLPHAL